MYRRSRRLNAGLTVVAVLVAVGIAGCGSSSKSSSSSNASSSSSSGASLPSTFGAVKLSSCPSSATQTISGSTITLGTSLPLSGPYAELALGLKIEQAYFAQLNKAGGIQTVDGKKKLALKDLDDAYDPARASANVRQLVQQDSVSAVVDMVGTPSAAAASPYLNAQCIPQLFSESGSSLTLNTAHPFTSQEVTYVQEGNVLAQLIKAKYPGKKVAVLYQDDEVGQGILKGLKTEGITPVSAQSYEPTDTTVSSQMTTLSSTKAPIFVDAGFSVMCSQSLNDANSNGWHPIVLVGSNCGSSDIATAAPASVSGGLFQAGFLQAPTGTDPDQIAYDKLSKSVGQTPNVIGSLAYSSLELAVEAIEHAKTLSPAGIALAATQLPSTPPALFAKGVKIGDGVGKAVISQFVILPWNASQKQFNGDVGTYVASKQ
jgi:branched-chain amino acid transport system substrate-binding protein